LGNFNPKKSATRLESTIIIKRFLKIVNSLETQGFYAINSYSQVDKINEFDKVIFGWSSLILDDNGKVRFTVKDRSLDYNIPKGYEELVNGEEYKDTKKTLMVFENDSKVLSELLDQENGEVIEDLVKKIEELGFEGVLIDFEGLRDINNKKEKFNNFLLKLRARLGDKNLAVAIHPRNVIGFYNGYDFDLIGKVADEVVLMSYDYQDKNFISASAPFNKVVESIKDAITGGIPANKLILGMQVVEGTQWRFISDSDSGSYYRPSIDKVYESVKNKNGEQQIDFGTMVPVFRYEVNQERNVIIFENSESVESKIIVANYFGLKGVSFWRMGLIQDDIFEMIKNIN